MAALQEAPLLSSTFLYFTPTLTLALAPTLTLTLTRMQAGRTMHHVALRPTLTPTPTPLTTGG